MYRNRLRGLARSMHGQWFHAVIRSYHYGWPETGNLRYLRQASLLQPFQRPFTGNCFPKNLPSRVLNQSGKLVFAAPLQVPHDVCQVVWCLGGPVIPVFTFSRFPYSCIPVFYLLRILYLDKHISATYLLFVINFSIFMTFRLWDQFNIDRSEICTHLPTINISQDLRPLPHTVKPTLTQADDETFTLNCTRCFKYTFNAIIIFSIGIWNRHDTLIDQCRILAGSLCIVRLVLGSLKYC